MNHPRLFVLLIVYAVGLLVAVVFTHKAYGGIG